RGLQIPAATEVNEQPGVGITGAVAGRTVQVGRVDGTTPTWARAAAHRAELDGTAVSWVSIDAELAGVILLHDPLRSDAARTLRRLRSVGLHRLVMLTGDRRQVAV